VDARSYFALGLLGLFAHDHPPSVAELSLLSLLKSGTLSWNTSSQLPRCSQHLSGPCNGSL